MEREMPEIQFLWLGSDAILQRYMDGGKMVADDCKKPWKLLLTLPKKSLRLFFF